MTLDRAMPHSRWSYIAALASGGLILSGVACSRCSTLQTLGRPTYRERVTAEAAVLATTNDTIYRRRLSDLIRRSQLVPIDSLARLHASIPTTADSALPRLRREVTCEQRQLFLDHGHAAVLRAVDRMADSLVRRGYRFERDQERMLSATGGFMEIRLGDCGIDIHRPLPSDSLNNEVYPTKYMRDRSSRPAPDSSGRRP